MHYKHEWFERTLVNASAKKTLVEAAPEWTFAHFGAVEKGYDNCQVCHARIVKFVAIKNTKNGVYLFIGADCYDKLLHYLATEKIQAVTLGERRQYISAIKKYCKKNINAAFLAWFKGKKRLTQEIRKTLAVIDALGYAPNLKVAEELVEYYKAHRRFPLVELLTGAEQYLLDSFSKPPCLPKTCTLNAWPEIHERFRVLVEAEKERKRKREEEERRRWEEKLQKQEELTRENGIAEMEGRIEKDPSRYQKGIFQRQIFRGKEEWFFRQNGVKYILSDRFGWKEKSETTYVTIIREIMSGCVYIVWPLVMRIWGWNNESFWWLPEESSAFQQIYPHHKI